MKKFLALLCALLLCVSTLPAVYAAQGSVDYTLDYKNSRVVMEGVLPETDTRYVSIMLTGAGVDTSGLPVDGSEVTELVPYVGQVSLGNGLTQTADGVSFVFTIPLETPEEKTTYTYLIKGDRSEPLSGQFTYIPPVLLYNALVEIGQASETDIAGVLRTHAELLVLEDVPGFSVLMGTDLADVYKQTAWKELAAGDYTPAGEDDPELDSFIQKLQEDIADVAAAAQISAAQTGDAAETLIRANAAKIGIQDALDAQDSAFAKLDDNNRTKLWASFCGKSFARLAAVGTYFNEQTAALLSQQTIDSLLSQLTSNAYWTTIKSICMENIELLGLDTTYFDKLDGGQKDDVFARMAGSDLTALETLQSSFAATSKEVYDEGDDDDDKPSYGGGGGGSYGGGSHVSVVPPVPTATPTPAPTAQPAAGFADDDVISDWAREPIYALVERGVLSGRADGRFDPAATVTREEFVKMAAVALQMPQGGEMKFTDVPDGHWAAAYIAAAVDAGMVSGQGDGTFGLGEDITRQDLVTMLYRAAGDELPAGGEAPVFADADSIADYAAEAVMRFAQAGIVSGSDGRFDPAAPCTREQAAKILYLLISQQGE